MSARQDIAGLLEQWRRLTAEESEAIQIGAWTQLKSIQAAKSDLQPLLNCAMDKWAEENTGAPSTDHPFRAEVNDLIALEAGNGQLLAAKMHNVQEARSSLEQAGRRLRRVHASYGQKRDAAWHSYS
jgi:hypothetical protein